MNHFIYKDGNEIYRVREEDEGCSIYTSSLFVEGNNSLFLILKDFSEAGIEETLNKYFDTFDKNVVKKDLLELFSDFSEAGLFNETYNRIRKRCEDII